MQQAFSYAYPYLRIEFLQEGVTFTSSDRKEYILQLLSTLTAGKLENIFNQQMGIAIRILRKTGNIWMEPGITKGRTLVEQNERGKDLSIIGA